jgi:hypothetical protein
VRNRPWDGKNSGWMEAFIKGISQRGRGKFSSQLRILIRVSLR